MIQNQTDLSMNNAILLMNYALLIHVLFSSELNKYCENVFFKFQQMCGVSPICSY